MRYICPGCERLVEPAEVRAAGDAIEITCPRCSEVETLGVGTPAANDPAGAAEEDLPQQAGAEDEPEEALEQDFCPKCGEPRGEEGACSHCGLVFAKWDPAAEEKPSAAIVQLWGDLEQSWKDRSLHGTFVEACLSAGQLPFAAKQYGSRQDAIAQEQLKLLTVVAFQAMQGAETTRRPNLKARRVVSWAVLFAIFLGFVGFLAYMNLR